MKLYDAVAFGSCYVDINSQDYPFGPAGLGLESEPVGGLYSALAGGSAVNFCHELSLAGLKTAFAGMAGQDKMGEVLADLLVKANVKAELVCQKGLQTNVGFNMTNPVGQQISCITGTANAAFNTNDIMPLLEKLAAETRVLYCGGCFKLKYFINAFPEVVALSARYRARLVIDHGKIPENTPGEILDAVKDFVLGADYYLPSRDEFCQLWGVKGIDEGLELLHRLAPEVKAVVKDAENGAFYWSNGGVRHIKTTPVKKVTIATGAGDSFNAGLIASILSGEVLMEAIINGCKVAALRIGSQGKTE